MPEEQFTFPGNDFNEITVTVPSSLTDEAAAVANMAVPYGIYIEDYRFLESDVELIAHINLIDEELLKKDRTKSIIHLYIPLDNPVAEAVSFLSERLGASEIPFEIGVATCREEDWANNWKKYFHPVKIGERLLIRPIWEEAGADAEGRVVLDLEPGMAFGTGAHETTRLCLALTEKHVKKGSSFLDVGCGSGILAVAALLLGSDGAFGVDIDPAAVKTARANAELNGVGDRFTAVCGSLTEKVSEKYDVVAANIVADVILMLLPDVGAFMKDDGVLLLSGIVEARLDEILCALGEQGFTVSEVLTENGWVAISAVR